MNLPHDYDDWKLNPPEHHAPGMEEGDSCNRVEESDEDAPRGYRPRPCTGVMYLDCTYGDVVCEICGSLA